MPRTTEVLVEMASLSESSQHISNEGSKGRHKRSFKKTQTLEKKGTLGKMR